MTKATEEVKKPKKYRVTIHAESGEGGDKGDVLLGHNFDLIQIKRGEEVLIEERFVDVLKGSLIDTQVKGEDGKMRRVQMPRYSYTAEPA